MKRIYLAFMLTLGSLGFNAIAEDYKMFAFTGRSGESWSFPVESLRMSPQGDSLVVFSASGDQSILDLNQLASAKFAPGDSSSLLSFASNSEAVSVYSIQGYFVGTFPSMEVVKSTLPAGIYILKSSSATSKLILR